MNKWGKRSLDHLEHLHPDLKFLCATILRHVDCSIVCGYRNEEEQNDLFHKHASKLKWPESKHNKAPSRAVDLYMYPIDFDDTKRNYWFGGFVLGVAAILKDAGLIEHSIRWGGDWDGDDAFDDQTFNDLVHFELVEG